MNTQVIPGVSLIKMHNRQRSFTPSPKKSKFTDPKRTSQLIKRLISRCCMLQKLKSHLEECLAKGEEKWAQVVGIELMGWESESLLMEFCDELNPQGHLRLIHSHMNKLVNIENDVLNVLDEIIDCVCTCIRKYSKKYGQGFYPQDDFMNAFQQQRAPKPSSGRQLPPQQHQIDYISNKHFLRAIVNSPSFQNSLQEKIQDGGEITHDHRDQSSQVASSSSRKKVRRDSLVLSEDITTATTESDDSEEKLLQLHRRSAIVKSAVTVMEEIIGSVESPLLKRSKNELEELFDRLCQKLNRHQTACEQVSSKAKGTTSTNNSNSPMIADDVYSNRRAGGHMVVRMNKAYGTSLNSNRTDECFLY